VKAVVQRVAEASVTVDGEVVGEIGRGLLVLLGVHRDDGEAQADRIVEKLRALRVFPDAEGRMNRSVVDAARFSASASSRSTATPARERGRASATRHPATSPSRSTSTYASSSARRAGSSALRWPSRSSTTVRLRSS
jgi:D-tyrosyl-tRNA(Tyr) deacylase